MSENEEAIHSLIVDYLVAHTQCGGCGQHYAAEDVRVRRRRDDLWLASMVCRHCGLHRLVMATVNSGQAQAMGPSAHVGDEERDVPPMELGPISGDDVLDLHRFLQNFGGDVFELLGES
jgi:hypothetical protein